MKEKQIRLELILQILDMAANYSIEIDISIIAPEKFFSKWVTKLVQNHRNNIMKKTVFDEVLYNQVNTFFTENFDVLQLFISSKIAPSMPMIPQNPKHTICRGC